MIVKRHWNEASSATQHTFAACYQMLDYLALHPNNGITYKASKMIACALRTLRRQLLQ